MEFNEFIQWSFLGIVTAGVGILYQMKGSMNNLNTKLAVFVERLQNHQEKLNDFSIRLKSVEDKTSSYNFKKNT